MIDFVKSRNVTLELCPTSNWLTKAIPNKESHPFRQLFETGVKTTINTDDGGIFNVNLNQEYEQLEKLHSFSSEEFERCIRYAYEASFIAEEKKKKIFGEQLMPKV